MLVGRDNKVIILSSNCLLNLIEVLRFNKEAKK